MAVKIRLKQTGKRNRRSYRVVAVDESQKRDGRVIEELGILDSGGGKGELTLNRERITYWINVGATPSAAVESILKK